MLLHVLAGCDEAQPVLLHHLLHYFMSPASKSASYRSVGSLRFNRRLCLNCWLQPKWSRDGRYIAYDSSAIWSTGMQVCERVGFDQNDKGASGVCVMMW